MYQIDATTREAFERDGFVVLESAIDADTLAMLREECDGFVARTDRWLEARGTDTHGITHRGRRYFIANRYRESARMPGFLFGGLMRTVARTFLGPTVYLFHEQWVVKGAEQGMRFAWHQDSGYIRFGDPDNAHAPYLTCWCALDDMTRENGTISVLSQERIGSRNTVFPIAGKRARTTWWGTRATSRAGSSRRPPAASRPSGARASTRAAPTPRGAHAAPTSRSTAGHRSVGPMDRSGRWRCRSWRTARWCTSRSRNPPRKRLDSATEQLIDPPIAARASRNR